MHRCFPHPVSKALFLASMVGLMLYSSPAYAHKIKLFATGDGSVISGYVYFPGGGRAKKVTVQVLGPDGRILGSVTTDKNGDFTFEAKFQCDHKLVVSTLDGHSASYMVKAGELAGSLPAYHYSSDSAYEPQEPGAPGARETASAPSPASATSKELEAMIEAAVNEKIRPLREQLEALSEKRRLQDVLGGIGYILGLSGVAFYCAGLGRKKRR